MPDPVAYAEHTLGVHALYAEWQHYIKLYDGEAQLLAEDQASLRELRANLEDLEFVIVSEWANKDAGSQAERDRGIKLAIGVTPACQDARRAIRSTQQRIDVREATLHGIDRNLTGLVARMNALGGLLNFYAARLPPKQVTTITTTTPVEEGT